jgi:predicted solute-binding protein
VCSIPERKINVKNILLILGVAAFDAGIGIYDRIVNNTGTLKAISDAYYGALNATTSHAVTSARWAEVQSNVATSSFSLSSVLLIAIVGVALMSLVVGSFAMGSAME